MSENHLEEEDAAPSMKKLKRSTITPGDCEPAANSGMYPTVKVPEMIYNGTNKGCFQRGRFLGKGGFAYCYEVLNTYSKKVMACKAVNKKWLNSRTQEKLTKEISIHRDLKHNRIIEFYFKFEDSDNVYIMAELCSNKSLMEMIYYRTVITEYEAKYFLKQLIDAVSYLHEKKNIIHRDIKPLNLFLNQHMQLKVGDFGDAVYYRCENERKNVRCGTPNYQAPEMVNFQAHGYPVDIWSIGCTLFAMLVGHPPFETDSVDNTRSKIRRGEWNFPTNGVSVSPQAQNLISRMLHMEPALRPNCKEILESEFLRFGFIPISLPASCLRIAPSFIDLI